MSDEGTWDWERVKAGYEQGISLRSLVAASGRKKSTIASRAKREKWVKPGVFRTPPVLLSEVDEVYEKPPEVSERIDEVDDDLTIVTQAVTDLAHHLQGQADQAKLDLHAHKLFADALSQYIKLKYTIPDSGAAPAGIDWSIFTPDELAVLQPIFERALARQPRPENVTVFRKQATT